MQDFRQLEVWRASFQLSGEVHRFCKYLPKDEQFSLGEQMRRCSLSIPSNIAEGKGRQSDPEMKRFSLIAYGSAMELQTQLLLCQELQLASNEDILKLLHKTQSVLKLLNRFIQCLRRQP
jgi:four helix bundle protein